MTEARLQEVEALGLVVVNDVQDHSLMTQESRDRIRRACAAVRPLTKAVRERDAEMARLRAYEWFVQKYARVIPEQAKADVIGPIHGNRTAVHLPHNYRCQGSAEGFVNLNDAITALYTQSDARKALEPAHG